VTVSGGEVKLTPDKTWIPVGVAIAGLVSLVTGAVWVTSSFQSLEFSNRELSNSIKRVESTLDRLLADGVSTRQMQQWIEILKARNPSILVPELPK
jgi:hypothetical protein